MEPEEYEDGEGNVVVTNGENIIISNQCLIMDMDISGDATIECSHFEPVGEDENFPFLKYLK